MSKTLQLDNLHSATTSGEVRALCTQFGTVLSVDMLIDQATGASRGSAHVEMTDGADAALEILNQHFFQGNRLMVREAKLLEPRKNSTRYKPA
jgi:RNA recognition motif-containing protein